MHLAALDFTELIPLGVTLPVALVILFGSHALLRRSEKARGTTLRTQSVMLALTAVATVAIVLALPIEQTSKHDVLNLIAVLGSAALALASTTFLSNVLAGLMLHSMRNFGLGDFIRCEGHFGRVTERDLTHIEIQTEDRDLTTLPNLLLIQKPITVVRGSGTILSTSLSLGYDVPRKTIQPLLVAAAEGAGLTEPFVQVQELGDFSVTYRVAGLLEDVRQIISARSRLNGRVLDTLHEAGIEIMSPTFMNTRALDPNASIVPPSAHPAEAAQDENDETRTTAEDLAFDKADMAQSLAELNERLARLKADREALVAQRKAAKKAEEKAQLKDSLKSIDVRIAYLEKVIETRESDLDSEGESSVSVN